MTGRIPGEAAGCARILGWAGVDKNARRGIGRYAEFDTLRSKPEYSDWQKCSLSLSLPALATVYAIAKPFLQVQAVGGCLHSI